MYIKVNKLVTALYTYIYIFSTGSVRINTSINNNNNKVNCNYCNTVGKSRMKIIVQNPTSCLLQISLGTLKMCVETFYK